MPALVEGLKALAPSEDPFHRVSDKHVHGLASDVGYIFWQFFMSVTSYYFLVRPELPYSQGNESCSINGLVECTDWLMLAHYRV